MTEQNIQFSFPKRFDEEEAKEGVWLDVKDELDQDWGSFKCSLFDRTSVVHRVAHQRWIRKNKKLIDSDKLTPEQLGYKVFVDVALHDWKVKDAKGKAIPFSKETAYAYFTHPDAFFVADLVVTKASDILNFQGEPSIEAEAKEEEKN